MFYEVCEPCKTYLDNGEDLPLPLLSRLLKFKLLDIKQNDIKRKEAEKKVSTLFIHHVNGIVKTDTTPGALLISLMT